MIDTQYGGRTWFVTECRERVFVDAALFQPFIQFVIRIDLAHQEIET